METSDGPRFFTLLMEIRSLVEAGGHGSEKFPKLYSEFGTAWELDQETPPGWPAYKQGPTRKLVAGDPNHPDKPALVGTLTQMMNTIKAIKGDNRQNQDATKRETELRQLCSQFLSRHDDLLQEWGVRKEVWKGIAAR